MSEALLPRRLSPGGQVRVIAPAAGLEDPAGFDRVREWFASKGFSLTLSEDGRALEPWHGGGPEVRARDLQAAFADPEVDAVLCLRGGYGCAQLLPLVDWAAVAASRKPFVGFSDVTALHCALAGRLVTFYGPTAGRFLDPDPLTASRLLDVLTGDATGPVPWQPSDRAPLTVTGGRASGPLAGGWLTGLTRLLGTPWQPSLAGRVVLLEEVSASPLDIDRMLLHLQLAGLLDGVAGFVVGELADCEAADHPESPQGRSLLSVIEARLGSLGVPVLYDVPVGHGWSLSTVPLGVRVTLDAGAQDLVVEEPALA